MRDHPAEAMCAAGLRGPFRRDDVLYAAGRSGRIAPLQAMRAGVVLGDAHLRSAALHAQRSIAEGRQQADRSEVEFLRYLAGERQIRRALDKAGVAEVEPELVVVAFGPHRKDAVRHFIDQLGAREDDGILDATPSRLEAWGFSKRQLEATTPANRHLLVLEAVALVDVRTNP
jgi:KEOPS complex subunit Cgi121